MSFSNAELLVGTAMGIAVFVSAIMCVECSRAVVKHEREDAVASALAALTAAPSSVPPVPVFSAAPVPSVFDEEERRANARLDSMIERCHAAAGIPVVGYGWRVVCLKPSSAVWWDDPKHPEFRSTLKENP